MQMGVGGKTQKGGATTYIDQTQQTLNNLMDHDSATTSDKELEIGWRGAEAYHFFMLAQSQLYNAQGGGNFESCMRTALRLMEYEDILVGRPVATMATLKPLY
jgi:WD repeat-containing protein 35